jgi:hypothetical protein
MHRPEMGRELSWSVGIAVGIADEWEIGWAVDFEVGTEYGLAEVFRWVASLWTCQPESPRASWFLMIGNTIGESVCCHALLYSSSGTVHQG